MSWVLSAFADEASERMAEQIRILNETGIDHVDLRLVDGINIVDLPLDHARRVQQDLESASISVGMYGSPIGKLDLADDPAQDLQRLEHLAKLRDIFGSNRVRLFSYFNQEAAESEESWKRGAFDRLIDAADRLDMVLFHENELNIYGDSVEHVMQMARELRASHPDRFKLIFDFDNFMQCGESIDAAWETLADHTDAIHLKESKRMPDGTHQHVPAGEGDGRIPEVLEDLARRGFDGPFTLEPHLARSKAVVATGPHGQANQSLGDMNPMELFAVAAKAAQSVMAGAQGQGG